MLKQRGAIGYYCLVLLALSKADVAVRVPVGDSFRVHMFPIPLENATRCTLTNPQNVVTIIPLDPQDLDLESNDAKIQPLGNNQCGARVHDTTARGDVGRWTLTVSNEEASVSEIFRVTTVTWEEPINRTSTAVIGSVGTVILCGPSNNMIYCEMWDPAGNLVELNHRSRCQTQITRLTADHFGVWTCTVGVIGGPSEIRATHTLEVVEPNERVVIFSNETELGTLISWQIEQRSVASLWCRAFPPNGHPISVAPGMEDGNYVSLATNLADNKCGLMILGNFTEEYHGVWRLEMGVNLRRAMGGFIKMPEGKIPGPNDHIPNNEIESNRITEINVATRDSFRISCETPYTAAYCWIGGPLGQEYTASENLTVGRCSQMVNTSTAAQHSGDWTCNMAHIGGGPEERFLTRVNIIEQLYQAVHPELTVNWRTETVIACRSTLNYPLEYCRFVRPDGMGFGVAPGMEPSGRYSYVGPGLDHGYCGLAISSVEEVDIGKWKCASRSRLRMWDPEISDTLILQTPVVETIVFNGIAKALLAVTILIVISVLILLLVKCCRLNKQRRQNANTITNIDYSK